MRYTAILFGERIQPIKLEAPKPQSIFNDYHREASIYLKESSTFNLARYLKESSTTNLVNYLGGKSMTAKTNVNLVSVMKNYHISEKAISLASARKNGKSNDDLSGLISSKVILKDQYYDCVKEVLNGMPLRKNIVDLGDDFTGIRYFDKNHERKLEVAILNKEDEHLITRNGNSESELSEEDINNLLPSVRDEEKTRRYDREVLSKAVDTLEEYLGSSIEKPKELEDDLEKPEPSNQNSKEGELYVSNHAINRWVERILKVKPKREIESYAKMNHDSLYKTIQEKCYDAEFFWFEPSDEVSYYFGEDNIMYVVANKRVLTLYEEDFGFTPEINRLVTIQQKEVIQEAHNDLLTATDDHDNSMQEISRELQNLDDNIQVMEKKIALLKSNRKSLLSKQDESFQNLNYHESRYTAETNKLFKKWEMPND